MKTTLQVLTDARKLIELPENWWDGRSSDRGVGGNKQCAIEAIDRLADEDTFYSACRALKNIVGESITHFNDNHPHAEVLAAFDKAIAAESH